MTKRILFILTSHAHMGNTGQPTGFYLPELAHPYKVFHEIGYEITVASPQGGIAPVDPKSLSDDLSEFLSLAQDTLPLSLVEPEQYDAFFVVGGHGTVWDLAENQELQRILPEAYRQGKVLAAVCHGPAALVNLKDNSGEYLIKDKKVTGFTNAEEAAVQLTTVVPFLLEDALKKAGGQYVGKTNWQINVVEDDRLITGQNPASAQSVAEIVLNKLEQRSAVLA